MRANSSRNICYIKNEVFKIITAIIITMKIDVTSTD